MLHVGELPHSYRHQSIMDNRALSGASSKHEMLPGTAVGVMATRPLVSVVDDDESVRESLPDLLTVAGFEVRAFSSAEAFLASGQVGQTRCLILDIAMPSLSGPDLQRELMRRGHPIPIVFITALGDETIRARLLQQGAAECLFKPFSDKALLAALNAALRVE
jgi:FixJ family two-component response regulator